MPNAVKLRKQMRASRLALSPRDQRLHALAVAKHYTGSTRLLRYDSIAIYIANKGEIDPALLATKAREYGKRIFFPVLQTPLKQALWFCEYRPGDPLYSNRFGIPEPDMRRRRPVPPWALDLILLPLVAFDVQGNRLGMGGGFYDRTLSYLRHRNHWRKPMLVGLAHECQKLQRIEPNSWDIPMDGILTETGLSRCRLHTE